MNKLTFTKIGLTAAALLLGTASTALASGYSNCETVYGGGTVCPPNVSFTLDKLVKTSGKGGEFVDNLTINDTPFTPNQDVTFQIKVKNTGTATIDSLNIVDTLPETLTYVSGGTYNANLKTASIAVKNLEAGKEAVYFITTKVSDSKTMSNNPQCVTNRVNASDNSGNKAEDTANLCVATPGAKIQAIVPTKTIPNTGPEALLLFALPPLGAAGVYLRRKAGL